MNVERDQAEEIARVVRARMNELVRRGRRHRAQALVFGVLLGYAAGVWTTLGVQ